MQRLFSCALGLLLMLCASAGPALAAGERFALLIGNSRYEVAAPLRNPENDIEMMAAALERSGFSTRKVANAGQAETLEAVDGFIRDVAAAENPVVMVYFAGHGVQLDGENYLLPVDVKVGSKEEIKARSLALGELSARLDRLDSRLQIVVLDSCRDNPFEDQSRGLQRGLAEAPEKLGKLVAFSTSPGNVASDGDTGASPYAAALAETVTIPGLTLEDVFKRVRATVKERTGGKQEPWENSAVYGEFRFVESPADAGQADEVAFFEFAALADSQEAYQKYLSRFPDGMFASLAKQKIEFMDKDFSFRRQNETFQYVTFENDYDDRCGPFRFNGSDEQLRSKLADGEVVLVKFVYWFPYQSCAQTTYFHSFYMGAEKGWVPYAANDPQRNIYAAYSMPFEPGWEESLRQIADTGRTYFYLSNGGLGEDHFSLRIDRPSDVARAAIVDTGCEDQCIYIQALMRFDGSASEAGQVYRFEFVSAADLGLTWKYQNTLRKVAEIEAEEQKKTVETYNRQHGVDGAAPLYDPVAAEPYLKTRTVAGWDLAAVVEADAFKNCRAFRVHRGPVLSFFRRYPDGRTSLGFFDPAAKHPHGFERLSEVRIDGTYTLSLRGRAYSQQEIAYDLGTRADLVEALKAGSAVIVDGESASLAGSKAMLTELEKCASAFAPVPAGTQEVAGD